MYSTVKRIAEMLLAFVLLCFLAPVLLVVAILIRVEDSGRILFRQERVGRGGQLFSLLKFRTMTDVARTAHGEVALDDPEITRVGRVLRRFKIDEIPQLVNVLKGDISLVGPRPCLPQTLKVLGDKATLRHSIRPGLTGLAQVNGNIFLSWEERLAWDLEYVSRRSFLLDLKILLRTVAIVIFGEKWGLRV